MPAKPELHSIYHCFLEYQIRALISSIAPVIEAEKYKIAVIIDAHKVTEK